MPHKSAEEAKDALQGFVRNMKADQPLLDLGKEVFWWGVDGSEAAFRNGRLTIYISTVAATDEDPESLALTTEDRAKRRASEQKKLTREFTKHVAGVAFDLP